MTDTAEIILKNNHIRPTAMRLLVLQYLLKTNVTVSLTDIEKYFEKSDRITVYRTLKTFYEHDLVHKIDDGTGITKYALCKENCNCEIETDLHIHFHCKICKETICLPEHKIPVVNIPDGFKADDINLVITGTCKKCNSDYSSS